MTAASPPHPGAGAIARNTALLYLRQLLLLAVGLWTSRVILRELGVVDFGVYGVVSGLVGLGGILTGALMVATQRHLTYALGQGDECELRRVFSSSLALMLLSAVALMFLGETVGLWFVCHGLDIPPTRLAAAEWAFHSALAGSLVSGLLLSPYNATLVAHERFGPYAYLALVGAATKLVAALVLPLAACDHLKLYALLLLGATALEAAITVLYSRRHFAESRERPRLLPRVLRQMGAYAGWTYIGVTGALLRDAGGNVLLNLFHGPISNAANGIARQLYSIVNQCLANISQAVNPQITKSWARRDDSYLYRLLSVGSRACFCLTLTLGLPLALRAPDILQLWLGQYPPETVPLLRGAMLFLLLESASQPLITAASAQGDIRNYQLLVGGLQALNFPLAWLALSLGAPSWSIYAIAAALSILCLAARLYTLHTMIGLQVRRFAREVLAREALTAVVSSALALTVNELCSDGVLGACLAVAFAALAALAASIALCCASEERRWALEKLKAARKRM